jgi:acyl-CoA synthetase (AMP-forming)/AMP-acid ligase II
MPSSLNIAAHLPAMAARQPDTLAVAFPLGRDRNNKQQYLRWTYRQLEDESNAIARGLLSAGVTRGMRTVLMVPPSPDFFACVFALFKIGAVMVGIDPGMGVKNLKVCLAEAQPEAFIGIRKAHIARKLLGWAKATNRINILVGRRLFPFLPSRTRTLDQLRSAGLASSHLPVLTETQPEETAAILFTSGSTGIPKGVVYTHANFDAQVRALRDQYDIQPGEIDLCTFPLFALYAPALGMSAIVPKMDFTKPGSVEPRDIAEPVIEFNVTNMFGSPALLKRISESDTKAQALPCLGFLRRVISAGAPVPSRTIANIKQLLAAQSQVFTPYGATESIPVCSIGSDEILGETAALTAQGNGVCIGKPVASIDLRIIRISDDAIEHWSDGRELKLPSPMLRQGEASGYSAPSTELSARIGEICVRGPQVTRRYFNRDASTTLAKIACDDGTFFHRMGDLGYFDEKGRVWFCGRKSERIELAPPMYTAMVEPVFDELKREWDRRVDPDSVYFRTALVGVLINSQLTPVVCFEHYSVDYSEELEPVWKNQLRDQATKYDHTRGITRFVLFPGAFPTDIRHNSKINRPLLAKWAAKKLGGQPA